MDSLGDRMKKNYEGPNRHFLTRRVPVIIRIDGRAFHTYTKSLEKPFSPYLTINMIESAKALFEEQGCKLAYVQSDEASFLFTDYDDLNTEAWFGYNQSKLESVAASIFTAKFNSNNKFQQLANFDARAFNVPREEVANYFLWRAKDWHRNSLQMYARSVFSHKELHNKDSNEIHEMLNLLNMNWADLHPQLKNGTFLKLVRQKEISMLVETYDVKDNYEEINKLVNEFI